MAKQTVSDLKDLFKKAAEISKQVPESMQVAAFNRALDLLTGTVIDATAGESASAASSRNRVRKGSRTAKNGPTTRSSGRTQKRKGPQTLIAELADDEYFKSKRTIVDVQKKLEEKGHLYAQDSLSTPLLRLTRRKKLRRIKEKKSWVYVS